MAFILIRKNIYYTDNTEIGYEKILPSPSKSFEELTGLATFCVTILSSVFTAGSCLDTAVGWSSLEFVLGIWLEVGI